MLHTSLIYSKLHGLFLKVKAFLNRSSLGTGTKPSPRAAHAATAVGSYKMVVYGGATGSTSNCISKHKIDGGLAADELYLLDIKNEGEKGSWMVVQTDGPTPGKRYGHTMTYKNTYIFLFGGNTSSELINDTWFLPISKVPFKWEKLEFSKTIPESRIYHTTSSYNGSEPGGMVMLFGGRGKDQNPKNDLWTLYKRSDGTWEWVQAASKGKEVPAPRYQVCYLLL